MTADSGVSPVIGVLLMLTLTLIIAAIVNSYAGGLVDTKEKPPSVTLQASLHQSHLDPEKAALLITHISGDPLPVSDLSIILKPTKTFGSEADNNFIEINKANITNNLEYSKTWANGITSMKVGDSHGIFGFENISKLSVTGDSDDYNLSKIDNQGNTFYLEFYYGRNLIAKPEVLIQG